MQDAPQQAQPEETTVARGRPRAFDREAALAEATRLFWSKGYEATSIADLTKAMGIGSPSLYAAFGSKEALYAEALRYYRDNFETLFWGNFDGATSAREAVMALLMDSAASMSGCRADVPAGCMVALSSVASEGHAELGAQVHAAREGGLKRLQARIERAIAEGELPAAADAEALARFVLTVQSGMSVLARDGASRVALEDAARIAMMGWDAAASGAAAPAQVMRSSRRPP